MNKNNIKNSIRFNSIQFTIYLYILLFVFPKKKKKLKNEGFDDQPPPIYDSIP